MVSWKSGKKVLKKVWGIGNVSNTARKFSKIIPGIDQSMFKCSRNKISEVDGEDAKDEGDNQ